MSVVDGDTINVRIDGLIKSVRNIGIDTPKSWEYYAYLSTLRNVQFVVGKWITLVKDVSETDKYYRLLRYVLVDDVFMNEVLEWEGFATMRSYPPDKTCSSAFNSAHRLTRSGDDGVCSRTDILPITAKLML